uniref:NAC domain-containing protein n=1 Tax=Araucaria cunninghamii TaxID=56994 RepID=A0A0D6QS34_ARACU
MDQGSRSPELCSNLTDEDLIDCLAKKTYGLPLPSDVVISEVDPYKFEPWDLRDLPGAVILGKDSKLYFFSPIDGNYSKGRTKRATEAGSWEITGKNQTISGPSETKGIKTTKIFYRRRPCRDEKNWHMHEYMLIHDDSISVKNSVVLCKVFQKNIPQTDEYAGSSSHVHTSGGLCTESELRPYRHIKNDSDITQSRNKGLCTDSGLMSSRVMENEFHILETRNVFNPVEAISFPGQTPMEDACTLSEDSLDSEDVDAFLMRCITDPTELEPNGEENQLQAQHVANQAPLFPPEDFQFYPISPDQHDLPSEILEGDFIELNDLITPLSPDSVISELLDS